MTGIKMLYYVMFCNSCTTGIFSMCHTPQIKQQQQQQHPHKHPPQKKKKEKKKKKKRQQKIKPQHKN